MRQSYFELLDLLFVTGDHREEEIGTSGQEDIVDKRITLESI
jgi:hypothetical protein